MIPRIITSACRLHIQNFDDISQTFTDTNTFLSHTYLQYTMYINISRSTYYTQGQFDQMKLDSLNNLHISSICHVNIFCSKVLEGIKQVLQFNTLKYLVLLKISVVILNIKRQF